MALRPVQARGLDLLLASRGVAPRCVGATGRGSIRLARSASARQPQSPLFAVLRTIHSSPRNLFNASARSSSPNENDQPPTPFQSRIAALEIAAQSSTGAAEHLALLRELLQGGEYNGLASYYEGVALAEDGSGSDALLKSDEAWNVYMEALSRAGRLGEVVAMVRKRDRLLGKAAPVDPPPVSTTAAAATAEAHQESTPGDSASSAAPSASTVADGPKARGLMGWLESSFIRRRDAHFAAQGIPVPDHLRVRPIATGPTATTGPAPATPSVAGVTPVSGAGTVLNPIWVQMAPTPTQSRGFRLLRFIASMAFYTFITFTLMSMLLENTGMLKTSAAPMEFEPEEGKVVKFSDVHGVEEAKAELEEIVEFLRNPEKFSTLGGKLPKGVLLTGPPGTGKTMLARAVAGEAGVPFLFASGSSFDEMFVGVGAKRVRELFATARKKSPAIIFIDELDAIGSKRSAKDQHYMKQTLNQLLVELDGFEQAEGVIIIAATNFPESLDKALTRPGRFDRHVVVGLPDVRGRIEILKHHMSDVAFDVDVDPSIIARGCPGMSGADLQNLVNQAAVKASREGSSTVSLKHFEWAKDRILMGAERRSHFVTDESKKATAYHEGGHALVALHTPGAMPLHKVTIMPRGQALGITFQLPEQDKDSFTRREYNAMIDVALGGRAAEEMIYGRDDTTSGCSSDLQRATDVATRMIRSYGFSDKVGLVAHGDDESVYLSGKKKDEIESEIRSFLDQGMDRTVNLLKTHEHELHRLAEALLEYETLSLDEVKQVLAGNKLERLTTEGQSLQSEAEKAGKGSIVEGI
ncbi:hypothetical protein IAT38_008435 [Cryptococcus sp. DSM 104549]